MNFDQAQTLRLETTLRWLEEHQGCLIRKAARMFGDVPDDLEAWVRKWGNPQKEKGLVTRIKRELLLEANAKAPPKGSCMPVARVEPPETRLATPAPAPTRHLDPPAPHFEPTKPVSLPARQELEAQVDAAIVHSAATRLGVAEAPHRGAMPKPAVKRWLELRKRPQYRTMHRLRPILDAMVEGKEVDRMAPTTKPQLLNWFGTTRPGADIVKEFLEWVDKGSPITFTAAQEQPPVGVEVELPTAGKPIRLRIDITIKLLP